MKDKSSLQKKARSLHIGEYSRHIFLCIGPDCCSYEKGEATWKYLKKRLNEIGFADCPVYRSKAACLRVCKNGPIAVVYPEGAWYANVSPEVCEEIIQKHLIGGEVAERHQFAENALPFCAAHDDDD